MKNSLAPEAKSIAFRLSEDSGFEWIGEYDINADDLLSGTAKGTKQKTAMDFLENLLADGKMPQTKIAKLADEQGISNKTLRNAKKALDIQAVKVGSQWCWEL